MLRIGDRIVSVNDWAATDHSETTRRMKKLTGGIRVRVRRHA